MEETDAQFRTSYQKQPHFDDLESLLPSTAKRPREGEIEDPFPYNIPSVSPTSRDVMGKLVDKILECGIDGYTGKECREIQRIRTIRVTGIPRFSCSGRSGLRVCVYGNNLEGEIRKQSSSLLDALFRKRNPGTADLEICQAGTERSVGVRRGSGSSDTTLVLADFTRRGNDGLEPFRLSAEKGIRNQRSW